MSDEPLIIRSGAAFVYRVYDVAEEVHLGQIAALLRSAGGKSHARIAPGRPEALIVKDAPIRVHLGERRIEIAGFEFASEVTATIWNYGTVSIRYQLPLAGRAWRDLVRISRALSEAPVDDWNASTQYCRELLATIDPATRRPSVSRLIEDYAIYALREVEKVGAADELLAGADLPGLLLGEEQGYLSARVRTAVLQGLFQYSARDLTLIDWDSAVILDPAGAADVVDIIEFALTHLLELRVYDDLLDQRLNEFYEAIEAGRRRFWQSPFQGIAEEANTRYVEFSELTERIDNSLKVVGDYYLATIFRGATQRFRTPDWQQSIARKMGILSRVSSLLQGEVNVRRGLALELVVVLLFVLEIALAVLHVTIR